MCDFTLRSITSTHRGLEKLWGVPCGVSENVRLITCIRTVESKVPYIPVAMLKSESKSRRGWRARVIRSLEARSCGGRDCNQKTLGLAWEQMAKLRKHSSRLSRQRKLRSLLGRVSGNIERSLYQVMNYVSAGDSTIVRLKLPFNEALNGVPWHAWISCAPNKRPRS